MYDQRLKNSKQGNWIIWTISSVAFDNDELLVEDSFDDKLAPIMLQSSLTKHLLKADILFRREFEIIPVNPGVCCCRASDPLFWTCHIVGCKVAWLGNATRPRRASTFVCRKTFRHTKVQLAPIWRWEKAAPENCYRKFENSSATASGTGAVPGAILQPSGTKKKPAERTGAVVSGHRNRGISVGCILQHERSVFLLRSLFRYKPH